MNENRLVLKYLKPYLTQSYFVQYGQLYDTQLHDITFKTSLIKIGQMANNDPNMPDQTPTSADNALFAKSIMQYKVAKACGIENETTDQSRLLVEVLRESLAAWGLSPREIDKNTRNYDQNVTVKEFRNQFINSHIIKALALPDDEIYRALAHEINLPANRNKRFHKFDLTPEFFVLHLKRTDSLYNDRIRENFFENLRAFVQSVESTPFDIDHPTDAQILQLAGGRWPLLAIIL